MKPKVSIVIINWNRKEDIIECLQSLRSISYPNFNVTVVDNASTDGSQKAIKNNFPEIKLIELKKNLGCCQGNNTAIKDVFKERANYILRLDSDTVVKDSDFLDILINYADNNRRVGIVGPKVHYYKTDVIQFAGGKINYLTGFAINMYKGINEKDFKIIKPYEVDYAYGACLLIKREVIEKIGLLDPIYFNYYDETDWCFRAKKAGYKVMLIPQTSIWHKKRQVKFEKLSSNKAYLLARNAIIFGRKNLKGFKKISYFLAQFIIRAPFNLIFLMQDFNAFRKYIIGICHGILTKI